MLLVVIKKAGSLRLFYVLEMNLEESLAFRNPLRNMC